MNTIELNSNELVEINGGGLIFVLAAAIYAG